MNKKVSCVQQQEERICLCFCYCAGLTFVWILLSLWYLRRVQDAYQINVEFKVFTTTFIMSTVATNILSEFGLARQVVPFIEVFATQQLLLFGILTFPLVSSFVRRRVDSASSVSREFQFPPFLEVSLLYGYVCRYFDIKKRGVLPEM